MKCYRDRLMDMPKDLLLRRLREQEGMVRLAQDNFAMMREVLVERANQDGSQQGAVAAQEAIGPETDGCTPLASQEASRGVDVLVQSIRFAHASSMAARVDPDPMRGYVRREAVP